MTWESTLVAAVHAVTGNRGNHGADVLEHVAEEVEVALDIFVVNLASQVILKPALMTVERIFPNIMETGGNHKLAIVGVIMREP